MFQKTFSLQETGKFDFETKVQLTKLESISNKINNHQPLFNFYKNKAEGDVLQAISQSLSERTLFIADDGFTHVIAPDRNSYKYLKVFKNEAGDGFLVSESHLLRSEDVLLFDAKYQEKAATLSTGDVEIFHFGAIKGDKMDIQLGKTKATIPAGSEEQVFSQIAMKAQQSASSKIIISRDDFIRDLADNSYASFWSENDFKTFVSKRINPQHIIEKLRSKFPDKTFFLGGDLEKDLKAVTSIPKINSSSDVTAFIAPKSMEVGYDVISKPNVQKTFTNHNISVIDLDNPALNHTDLSSNVILVSGNKDKNFEKYLGTLLTNYEVKDKVIVTFSCFKEGNDFINSFIIKNFKAHSIIYFPTEINPDAVKKVLLRFSASIKNSNGSAIRDIMEKSIEEAYMMETVDFLKLEIGKLRKFIQQTSFNYEPLEKMNNNKS
jgi:hypothetical protein